MDTPPTSLSPSDEVDASGTPASGSVSPDGALSTDGGPDAATAIMTTDSVPKQALFIGADSTLYCLDRP